MSHFNKEQADPRLRAFDPSRMVPEFNDILCLLVFTTLSFILFLACGINLFIKCIHLRIFFKKKNLFKNIQGKKYCRWYIDIPSQKSEK